MFLSSRVRAPIAVYVLLALGSRCAVLGQTQIQTVANSYIDSEVCAACHPAIARTYRQTGMSRSFYRPQVSNMVEDYADKNQYYHYASDTHYEMVRQGDHFYQRRYQIGYDGKQSNLDEKQIDFVLGSGSHARTYLHRTTQGILVQLPLAWYSEKGGYWAMSPGYDTAQHPEAQRPIGYDCLFCHNSYPGVQKAADHFGDLPRFSAEMPEGIDCQRCHGPGRKHVAAASGPHAKPYEVRGTILNPSRLKADRQLEVCLQCHLQTDSYHPTQEFKSYGRSYFSYDPNTPLSTFLLFFEKPTNESKNRFQIVSSAYRLRQSECFLQSGGALTCTTCHNPHDIGHGKGQEQTYNRVCQTCHTAQFRSLIAAERHTKDGNCIGCHMPKRRTQDVVHVVMTDHLIQRRPPPGDLLADIREQHQLSGEAQNSRVIPYYPRQLALSADNKLAWAVEQARDSPDPRRAFQVLSQLLKSTPSPYADPYFEAGECARIAGENEAASALYKDAIGRDPRYVSAVLGLSAALSASNRPKEVRRVLLEASKQIPDDASLWSTLGRADVESEETREAAMALKRAITLDPDVPAPYLNLSILLTRSGALDEAETNLREAIRIQPNSAQTHSELANLLIIKKDLQQAGWEFEQAVRIDPAELAVRLRYAALLYTLRRTDDAQRQVEAALKGEPNSAEAHDVFGNILEQAQRTNDALREYNEAVRLAPAMARAQLDLGAVLAQTGDRAQAAEHLKLALQSDDPNVRRIASQLLNDLGKQ